MKITDFDKETHGAICFFAGMIGFMMIFAICSPHSYDTGTIIAMAICVLMLLAFSVYVYAENARYYLVDESGITSCFFGGRIKRHFDWEDFRSLVLCSVYVRRSPKPIVNFIYISTEDISRLSPNYLCHHAAHIPHRLTNHHKHVYFRFKFERYEYIKQFCPLELLDKRASKTGY